MRYTVITIKSALGTAPLTAQQPAKGKVLKAERWVNTNYKGLIGRWVLFFMSIFLEDIFMEKKKPSIYEGKTEAFLVYDESFKNMGAPFFSWLRSNGFTCGFHHGSFGCPWMHVNITRKQYAYGMPGVQIVKEIGNHAITLDEFVTIYHIYEKYQGLSVLVFNSDSGDCEA